MTGAADLHVRVLGDLAATRDGQPLELGPAKQRAVLALLLVNRGRPVPVSRIVTEVWGDDPPANGANVVQKYVAGLRRALDPTVPARSAEHVLSLRDGGYLLGLPPSAVDAEAFVRGVAAGQAARREGRPAEALRLLRDALALWAGEPYPGLVGHAVLSERDRLEALRGDALESCVELALDVAATGPEPVDAVLAEVVELVGRYPARERLRRVQVLALHRAGRTAEALEAYRAARAHLVEQYGIEPGAALRDAHREVLTGDPELLPRVVPAAPVPAQSLPAQPLPAPSMAAPSASATSSSVRSWSGWGTVGRLLAVAVPLLTVGLGTWAVLLVLARVRRSRRSAALGVLFLALTAVVLVQVPTEVTAAQEDRVGTLLIGFILLGTLVVAALVLRPPAAGRGSG